MNEVGRLMTIEQLIASPFVVGAAGALVGLKFVPTDASLWTRLTNLLCGSLTAGYCAGAAYSSGGGGPTISTSSTK